MNVDFDGSLLCPTSWNRPVDFISLKARSKSRGILYIWDTNFFVKEDFILEDGFTAFWGTWVVFQDRVGFINVYTPLTIASKRRLWSTILSFLVNNRNIKWVVLGDFNETRSPNIRKGSKFSYTGVALFNDFINMADLSEVTSGGRKYTRMSADRVKHSKLDRFFVSRKFLES